MLDAPTRFATSMLLACSLTSGVAERDTQCRVLRQAFADPNCTYQCAFRLKEIVAEHDMLRCGSPER